MIGFPPFTFFIFIMISFRHLRAFLSRQQQIEELREQFQGDIVELTATNHLTGSTVVPVLYILAADGTVEGAVPGRHCGADSHQHLTGITGVLH